MCLVRYGRFSCLRSVIMKLVLALVAAAAAAAAAAPLSFPLTRVEHSVRLPESAQRPQPSHIVHRAAARRPHKLRVGDFLVKKRQFTAHFESWRAFGVAALQATKRNAALAHAQVLLLRCVGGHAAKEVLCDH